jgi:hypothetical protein
MSVDLKDVADGQRLSRLLERVAELQAEKDRIAAEAKRINKALDDAEQMAVEVLAASGLDGVRAGGKSWFTQEWFSVSVPADNRDKVLEIARRECPEYIAVNAAQLKAWLKEHRQEGSESLAAGTPFDGLVNEYREVRLSHRTLG